VSAIFRDSGSGPRDPKPLFLGSRVPGPESRAPSIRLATEADAAAIANVYRPIVESTTVSFETEPPDEHEMRRRIAETLHAYPWLVYHALRRCSGQADGVVAGYAYASRHRVRAAYQWSVDVSVYVDAAYRRSGIARGLYTSLFAILAAQGFFNAYACNALPNPASVSLHEAMGFQPVGIYRNVGFKLDAWRDVGWWQLPLQQPDATVRSPLDMASVRGEANWDQLLSAGASMIRQHVV
jgi:L-amino acid N-acyltransferase YncA